MRHLISGWLVATIGCGLVPFGLAGEPSASSPAEAKKVETPVKTPSSAAVRAEIHRTLATLIDAQAAPQPNQAQIAELTKKLEQLRGTLRAQNQATAATPAVGWGCPWGGPGPGFGRGRGAGMGPGRGWGAGAGMGRGLGPGAGQGLGAGGAGFVDKDQDGLCDYYELRHGLHQE